MLRTANPARRLAGRAIILAATAIALPLTASRAIEYVDVQAPPASPAAAEIVPAAPARLMPASIAAQAAQPSPAAPAPRVYVSDRDISINGDLITIDGQAKRWEDLTPAEKSRVRSVVAEARAALENTHIDREKIMRDVAAATDKIDLDELQRNLAQSKAGVADAIRGIDESAAYIRASGQDPEQLKTTVREALESVRGIDVEAIKRSVAAIDQQKLAQSLAGAEQSMQKAKADLDRLDAKMRADNQH